MMSTLTDPLFFDTDCLAAFLWVSRENILLQLFRERMHLPQHVYQEITRVPQLKIKTESLIKSKLIFVTQVSADTLEAELYLKLSHNPDPGFKIIGRGEAAAIALAKCYGGILCSNNLRDIGPYIQLYELEHKTTGDILVEALQSNLITEGQGNMIWNDMLSRQRLLPAASFSDYLANR